MDFIIYAAFDLALKWEVGVWKGVIFDLSELRGHSSWFFLVRVREVTTTSQMQH